MLPLGGLLSEEEREACAYKYAEMQHYFAARIAERRDDPQDDMLTDMVAARLAGERPLDVPELLSICAQFLVAGNETTTKLITACAQLLCQHPDQLAAVRDDPSLVPGAVEESLRMESAVQTMFRTATRDTELAGVAIPKGGRVVLLIGAANRDPATFPDPDRFDVGRPNARFNLGFAHGEHYCIGAALARAEATIGVRALLTRLPGLRLGAGNTFLHEPSWTHRGLKELHLDFDLPVVARVVPVVTRSPTSRSLGERAGAFAGGVDVAAQHRAEGGCELLGRVRNQARPAPGDVPVRPHQHGAGGFDAIGGREGVRLVAPRSDQLAGGLVLRDDVGGQVQPGCGSNALGRRSPLAAVGSGQEHEAGAEEVERRQARAVAAELHVRRPCAGPGARQARVDVEPAVVDVVRVG